MTLTRVRVDGARATAMERARQRLVVIAVLFGGAFLLMGVRTLDLGLFRAVAETHSLSASATVRAASRADIVDRNGVVLATNLRTASLYADPKRILDPEDAAAKLVRILPDLAQAELLEKLRSSRRFVWIKRKLSPRQMWAVNALGLPGLAFQEEEERVYPQGRLAAHVLGFTDPDGRGLAGVEHFFDSRLSDVTMVDEPLRLSVDVRVQHALADQIAQAIERFSAKAGAGLVMDVRTGELLALASLPDYDPNHGGGAPKDALFNRASQGVYELGSTFKAFTIAMALETGVADLSSRYDASEPIRVSRFTIRDDHPQARMLSLPEVFVHSSNIGAAKMALDVGAQDQQAFLSRIGMLRPAALEISEVGHPLVPERWRDIATMTISYGHGIAVSPVQLATGLAAMVNGGDLFPATLIRKNEDQMSSGKRVISENTSDIMRRLMRLVVRDGTAKSADVPGYQVGGKTGTAEKPAAGGYARKALLSSFAGVFPMDDPRYLVFVLVDEPKGTKATWNFAGGGWTAAPTVAKIILRIAPILGVEPQKEDDGLFQQAAYAIEDSRRHP
ncbi:peptidoglycan glycosyltransferase [Iodidimonas muriae]|uniref:Peptidoglycan glycosyltransferase n=1 Tax=Iodidimonas muriae TaxID=261467 RepID=A0ABQ2LCN3_9PROT|nr:penicillin-binding protein 2 [Iodidimonas muriae]GER06793.1 peptidoglycan glycosyltransferase [Kordiimonadales bacterium JCM 17843]GGO09945.1 peptidoglycan glycosyltransferase [Iodidimonas muriae]